MMRLQNVCACCLQIDRVGETPKDICFLHVQVLKIVVSRVKYPAFVYIKTFKFISSARDSPTFHKTSNTRPNF